MTAPLASPFGGSTANLSLMLLLSSVSNLPPVILPLGSATSPTTSAPCLSVTDTTLNVPEKLASTSTGPATTSGTGPYLPLISVWTPLTGSGIDIPGAGGAGGGAGGAPRNRPTPPGGGGAGANRRIVVLRSLASPRPERSPSTGSSAPAEPNVMRSKPSDCR